MLNKLQIKMINFFYGCDKKTFNVTEKATQQFRKNNTVHIAANVSFNQLFGDVAPNVKKQLTIKFLDDNSEIQLPELRIKNFTAELNNFESTIPTTIMQYWDQDITSMPEWAKVRSNTIKTFHKTFEFVMFDCTMAIDFLKNHFDKSVVAAFRKCNIAAMRCDLFRYCYLYIKGGFYFDVKTICKRSFLHDYTNKNIEMLLLKRSHAFLFNGFIGSQPHTIALKNTIDECVKNIIHETFGNQMYLTTGTPVFTNQCKLEYNDNYTSERVQTIDYEVDDCPLTFEAATYVDGHWSEQMKQKSIYRYLDLQKLLKVDKIFVVNLKHRTDRLEQCKDEFSTLLVPNSQWSRFDAVRGADLAIQQQYEKEFAHFCTTLQGSTDQSYLQGGFGCLLSHLNLIKYAKSQNFKRILVLEDDFEATEAFTDEKILEQIGALEFDMFYLSMSNVLPNIPIENSRFCRVRRALSTGGYIINHTIYDIVIEQCLQYGKQIDVFFADCVQTKYNVFALPKCIVVQREGFSDIVQQNIKYKFET